MKREAVVKAFAAASFYKKYLKIKKRSIFGDA